MTEENDRLLNFIEEHGLTPSASTVEMKDGIREFHIWFKDPVQP